MNTITMKLQEILADMAAALWLARHSGSQRLVVLFNR